MGRRANSRLQSSSQCDAENLNNQQLTELYNNCIHDVDKSSDVLLHCKSNLWKEQLAQTAACSERQQTQRVVVRHRNDLKSAGDGGRQKNQPSGTSATGHRAADDEVNNRVDTLARRRRRLRRGLSWMTALACLPVWIFYNAVRTHPDDSDDDSYLEEERASDFCLPCYYQG